MAREVRLVLVAAGVVAILGTIALLLWLHPVEVVESGTTFKALEPVDVRRVLIRNETDTLDISYTGEGYQVDDIPAELVDMDEFIDLLTACSKVHAKRTVAAAPQDFALYGLDAPSARVAVTYADGSTLTLNIGDTERVTGDVYVSIEGDPAVYLMEAERCAGFLLPKKAYVEDLVTPRLALSSPLSALLNVTLSGGLLAEPVTIEAIAAGDPEVARAALSFGAPTHIVRGRGTYELDQTYGVATLGALLGITASDILGYALTPEEITAFGFDQPTMEVAFDLKNGIDAQIEHYDLAILHKDDAYYLTCNDNGVIYAVEEPAFLHVEYSKLLVRWFLSPLLIDVREIELIVGNEVHTFTLTGETSSEQQVAYNGEHFDIERFRDLYRLLTSAEHDGRLLENVEVSSTPLLTLTYHYRDPQKPNDVMVLYPGDARRHYVQINGVTELAMREAYLDRVREALATLWTDEPIKTEW